MAGTTPLQGWLVDWLFPSEAAKSPGFAPLRTMLFTVIGLLVPLNRMSNPSGPSVTPTNYVPGTVKVFKYRVTPVSPVPMTFTVFEPASVPVQLNVNVPVRPSTALAAVGLKKTST